MISFFFFDTETTGVDVMRDKIVQFWWILWTYDPETKIFYEEFIINQLINPLMTIPQGAINVHWKTQEMCEKFGSFDQYAKIFVSSIMRADYIVWHNIQYDWNILSYNLISSGLANLSKMISDKKKNMYYAKRSRCMQNKMS